MESRFNILDLLHEQGVTVLVALRDLEITSQRFNRVMLLTRRLWKMMVVGAAIAAASAVVRLYASYYLKIASGAAIVITCTGILVVVWAATTISSRLRGVAAKKNGFRQADVLLFPGINRKVIKSKQILNNDLLSCW